MELVDTIVIGGGPAGLSAALLLGRCRRRVIVFDEGRPRNEKSRAVHAYLGLEGIPPLELLSRGREELAKYPSVSFTRAKVTGAAREEPHFKVTLASGDQFLTRTLLVATGIIDKLPTVEGIEQYYGTSVHQCPYCDGWESSDRKLGVLGAGDDAAELALELLIWSPEVTIFLRGESPSEPLIKKLSAKGIVIEAARPLAVYGSEEALAGIQLEGGRRIACEHLFLISTQVQHDSFIEGLGCDLNPEGKADCPFEGSTDVPGLFVAGNASKGLQLALIAAAEGLRAAHEINTYLLDRDG
jgi:thioredoxin reductase